MSDRSSNRPLTSKAVTYKALGGPEVIQFVERTVRAPAAGEVRIEVKAAAVNPADILFRDPGWPNMTSNIVPGMDAAGVVESVGPGVSRLFYRRGYKDAGHHQMTLNPIRRTPEKRKRFNMAVTKMLESDIEMETEEICAELDRQKVTCHFKIRGALEEIGPRSWPWTQKPIPGAVTAAIERIRADITSQNYARKRQSLLSSTANDKHRKAKAATQGS